MNNLAIACNLTDSEFQERRRMVLAKLHDAVIDVKELADGYAYSFSSDGDCYQELAGMIDLERRCCPFLQFGLIVTAARGPLRVEITGPEGTKEFLASTFDWGSS